MSACKPENIEYEYQRSAQSHNTRRPSKHGVVRGLILQSACGAFQHQSGKLLDVPYMELLQDGGNSSILQKSQSAILHL
jgi:hypothetical protein